MFRLGKIDERTFLQTTEDVKTALLTKTLELANIISWAPRDTRLAHSCADVSNRIRKQAKRARLYIF